MASRGLALGGWQKGFSICCYKQKKLFTKSSIAHYAIIISIGYNFIHVTDQKYIADPTTGATLHPSSWRLMKGTMQSFQLELLT